MKKEQEQEKTEARIQSDCFQWFHNTYSHLRGLFYHVPNGEKRDPITASKLKAMGVVAGVPDCLFHFNSNSYFFEFKKPKTGRASAAQKKVIDQLDRQGFQVWLVESLEQFQELIETILADKSRLTTQALTRSGYYYKHGIFDYLYNLGNGQLVKIDDIVEKDNQANFVNILTEFITERYDKADGFEIFLTPDYKAFYKRVEGSDIEIEYNGKTFI